MANHLRYDKVPETAIPVLAARQFAVDTLEGDAEFNPDEATQWADLNPLQKGRVLGAVVSGLVENGVFKYVSSQNLESLREALKRVDEDSGKAADYTDGSTGLFVNKTMAAMASSGFIERNGK